ncbi:MAG: 16S rRNA (guanine(966)-N(2))-methyltransferase RsmD [Bradymonadia bacterium]
MIRIIAGRYRGSKIDVADLVDLRPTSDRTRSALFNLLTHRLSRDWSDLRILDAFAGSGALGFEALSRGAIAVTFVESNQKAVKTLHRNNSKLKASTTIIHGDSYTVLNTPGEVFDLVFLDPPFNSTNFDQLLKTLAKSQRLAEDCLISLEHPSEIDVQVPREFAVLVDRAYGRSNILILEHRG